MTPAIAITTGEPAGIGPDICLTAIASAQLRDVVLFGDRDTFAGRATQLNLDVDLPCYDNLDAALATADLVRLVHVANKIPVTAGHPDPVNATSLLNVLDQAVDACLAGKIAAMVTAPIAKHVICSAGITFSGHTEYIAQRCKVEQPVMLLAANSLRVALVTTHLPLRSVPDAINPIRLEHILRTVHKEMTSLFGIDAPRITVLALNPHAGENGFLGTEEIDILKPVIKILRKEGLNVSYPVPADTAFTLPVRAETDVFVAMYHDQGLPVLKFAGFSRAVNITLGLPIIRTSVDHGTAFDIAGTGKAQPDSLLAAIQLARQLSNNKKAA